MNTIKLIATAGAVSILCGCAAVGPDYVAPPDVAAKRWHANTTEAKRDESNKDWWSSFGDEALMNLIGAAQQNNPTIDKAVAAIDAARAYAARAGAKMGPTINASVSSIDSKSLVLGKQVTSHSATDKIDASWEIDLFGAVRRAKESSGAKVIAAQADYEDALVSLKAQIATEYINYKSCKLSAAIYQNSLNSAQTTMDMTHSAVTEGALAVVDEQLASASTEAIRSSLINQEAECDVIVKNITYLTAMDEDKVMQVLAKSPNVIPSPASVSVVSVPANLLLQRPDIVAAERSLAAASAEIGFAKANLYPRLTLMGNISTLSYTAKGASTIDAKPWSFGPTLSMPLFDTGATRAQIAQAQAYFNTAQANYKLAVLGAVKEVEQALTRLQAAGKREVSAGISAKNYDYHLQASLDLWRVGQINTITLEQSRRNALQAQQTQLNAQRDKVIYAIALHKALGGGWAYDPKEEQDR